MCVGVGGCRVTLHGVPCSVSTVAPACIDLDDEAERKRERDFVTVLFFTSKSLFPHTDFGLLLLIMQLLLEKRYIIEGSSSY